MKLSRRVFPGLDNYRLDTVADYFSIPISQRHRAGSDALATAEVFLHLLTRMNEHGVKDLAAARTFQFFEPKLREPEEASPLLPLIPGF